MSRQARKYLFRGAWMSVAEVAALTGRDKANVHRCIEGDTIREAKPCPPRYITYAGRTLRLFEWSRLIGVSHVTLLYRLSKWPVERALTTPVRKKSREARP